MGCILIEIVTVITSIGFKLIIGILTVLILMDFILIIGHSAIN